ncbi:MAG: glutamate dehydrogenase [Negativicutes bacterium]|nr:glutamate dehydrogenase [Negativicutes bacterium]
MLGGSLGRDKATARGCMFVIKEACKCIGIDMKDAAVAIQGFGNAGSFAAVLLSDLGCRIVAVSDSKGGIYKADGLDVEAVIGHKRATGTVMNFSGAINITNQELLTSQVQILVPAAYENQINAEIAAGVKARIVAEAANGPTTPEGDAILHEKGVLVIPDILASAGGVTVSYFKWVQNLANYYWTEEEVNERLERVMVSAFNNVFKMHITKKVDMRLAAYMTALSRIAEAIRLRGWINQL